MAEMYLYFYTSNNFSPKTIFPSGNPTVNDVEPARNLHGCQLCGIISTRFSPSNTFLGVKPLSTRKSGFLRYPGQNGQVITRFKKCLDGIHSAFGISGKLSMKHHALHENRKDPPHVQSSKGLKLLGFQSGLKSGSQATEINITKELTSNNGSIDKGKQIVFRTTKNKSIQSLTLTPNLKPFIFGVHQNTSLKPPTQQSRRVKLTCDKSSRSAIAAEKRTKLTK